MVVELFGIHCETCKSRLKVRDRSAIGKILACPKCGAMVQVNPPAGWQIADTVPDDGPLAPLGGGSNGAHAEVAPAGAEVKSAAAEPQEISSPGAVDNETAAGKTVETAEEMAATIPAVLAAPASNSETAASALEPSALTAWLARWGLWAAIPATVLGIAIGLWSYFAVRQPHASLASASHPGSKDQRTKVGGPKKRVTARPVQPAAMRASRTKGRSAPRRSKPDPVPLAVDVRVVPDSAELVLMLRPAELLKDGEWAAVAWRDLPFWSKGLAPLHEAFGIAPESVRRLTWSVSGLSRGAGQGVIAIELEEPLEDDTALTGDGESLEQLVLDAVCHRRRSGPWLHPFAVIDERTIVTGPIEMLEQLSAGGLGNRAPLPELLREANGTASAVVAIDLAAVRTALPDFDLLAAAADRADPGRWQAVRELPAGLSFWLSGGPPPALELRLRCTEKREAAAIQPALAAGLGLKGFQPLGSSAWVRTVDPARVNAISVSILANVPMEIGPEAAPDTVVASSDPPDAPPEARHEPPPPANAASADVRGALRPHLDVQERLSQKLGVEFAHVPLSQYVDFISQVSGLRLSIDPDALARAGLRPDGPVTIRKQQATIQDALSAVAGKTLRWQRDGEQLVLTSAATNGDALATATYNVRDLLAGETSEQFAERVKNLIGHGSWPGDEGTASMDIGDGVLTVRQIADIQFELASFFDRLRVARGLTAVANSTNPTPTLETRYSQAKAKLGMKTTANFLELTPLEAVTAHLERTADVALLIDWPSLRDEGPGDDVRLVFPSPRRTLAATLAALTEKLGVTFRIIDGTTIQILARKAAGLHQHVEFYPLAGAADDAAAVADLLRRIQGEVNAETWSENGGAGAIYFDAASKCLIVSQTQDVQIQVEELLRGK